MRKALIRGARGQEDYLTTRSGLVLAWVVAGPISPPSEQKFAYRLSQRAHPSLFEYASPQAALYGAAKDLGWEVAT